MPPYESTVTANLWRDGAVLLGKLNIDEFAMGSSNETSRLWPGDHAVAAPGRREARAGRLLRRLGGRGRGGLCPARTGTDTGGSIRQPAAFTGIVGIKPTYGRCSRWGIVAFASSLDQAGPIARDVRDCAILLSSMAGYDPKDTTSVDVAGARITRRRSARSAKGMRIGIPKEYRVDGMPPRSRRCGSAASSWLEAAGAEIVEISLPHTKYALPAYYIVAPAEASSNLARYDGVRYGLRARRPTTSPRCTSRPAPRASARRSGGAS